MCLSDLRKLLIVLGAILMPVEVWAAVSAPGAATAEASAETSRTVEVRVAAEVTAHAENVALGNVATIYANDEKDFAALSGLMISQFPSGQSEMHLPKSYLARRIQEVLPAETALRLNAPDQILLRLEKQGISTEELAEAIGRRAREDGRIPDWVETQVEVASGQDALKNLKITDVRIEPAGTVASWKGDLPFRVTETTDGGAIHWVRAKIRWFGMVWAAKQSLKAQQAVSPGDFEIARIELTNQREEVAGATENVDSLLRSARLRRPIAAGGPLVKAALERKPDAQPGQSLKVVFVSETGIRVTADGALLGNGSVGEEVKARLKSSRKVVTGRLVDGGTVEVNL